MFIPLMHGQNRSSRFNNINYGLLYNGIAISDSRFAPPGFRIPNSFDFASIIGLITPGQEGAVLKEIGFDHWDSPNLGAINELDFYALGAGIRGGNGTFSYFRERLYMHTTPTLDYTRFIVLFFDREEYATASGSGTLAHGATVRFVSDTPTSSVFDSEGNRYDVVNYQGKYWTIQNWKSKKYSNGDDIDFIEDRTDWQLASSGAFCYPNGDVNNVDI